MIYYTLQLSWLISLAQSVLGVGASILLCYVAYGHATVFWLIASTGVVKEM